MFNDETELIARLLTEHIPEIASGEIEIKAIARVPGHRCKVALLSHDPKVDCIGACVGVRGFHIKNIVDALDGERVDLIRWTESVESLIAASLQPAVIDEVKLQMDQKLAVVVVRPDQAQVARGRWGHSQLLARQLCGWQLEIEERLGSDH